MNEIARLIAARAQRSPDTPYLLAARAPQGGGKPAVVTFGELAARVAAAGEAFWRADLLPGARVGLRGSDPLAVAVAWLALVASGRVAAPAAPDLRGERFERWQAAVAPAALLEPGGPAGDRLTPLGGAPQQTVEPAGVLLTSSGTTGPPKLVALSTDQLLHTAGNVVAAHGLTRQDRAFNPLPLHHVNAEVVGLLAALVAGSSVVLDDRFHRTGFWLTVDRSGATWLNAVPAILAVLAATDPEHPVPARLRFARSASAPLPPAVRRAFEERTGLPVVETYGMTEAGSQIAAGTLGAAVPGSVGRPVGVELRVVADDGTPAAVDVPGRVQIRGAGVITRYAGGPAAAGQEMLTADGWLETGDVGRVAADGSLFLLGRRDDVINRGGEKIFPAEVEDVLLGTGVLRQAVVVGLPDPVLGRVPVAVVVPRDPCALADDGARQALVATLEAAAEQALERVRRPVRFYVLAAVPGASDAAPGAPGGPGAGGLGKVSRRRVAEALQQPTVPVGS